MSYIYLASPYSHELASVRHERYEIARNLTAELLRRSIWTYSPIVHCHDLAQYHNLPTDAAFWEDYNFAMLCEASALVVCCSDGWLKSKGIEAEVHEATVEGLPVFYVEPDDPATLLLLERWWARTEW